MIVVSLNNRISETAEPIIMRLFEEVCINFKADTFHYEKGMNSRGILYSHEQSRR